MQFKVVIPARHASTRLPGKPLLDIAGKPMVVRVVEQALASGAEEVIVATDHEEILNAVKSRGYEAVMTRPDHVSGTDRIAEVSGLYGWSDDTVVVNVQGDEPLIAPSLIHDVAQNLSEHPEAAMATACHPIRDLESVFNPNVVKVVMDKAGYAMYFSRAPIPYARDVYAGQRKTGELASNIYVYRHIGIYAYRASFLHDYSMLEVSPIEQVESLEQLRAMWHGYRIGVAVTPDAPVTGVDTEEDLWRVRACLLDRAQ